eukprot:m.82743 g.82743  ORF g.82743 m.82743 type:complete len:98 (-) comp8675_c0_seq1:456-749(-)
MQIRGGGGSGSGGDERRANTALCCSNLVLSANEEIGKSCSTMPAPHHTSFWLKVVFFFHCMAIEDGSINLNQMKREGGVGKTRLTFAVTIKQVCGYF